MCVVLLGVNFKSLVVLLGVNYRWSFKLNLRAQNGKMIDEERAICLGPSGASTSRTSPLYAPSQRTAVLACG